MQGSALNFSPNFIIFLNRSHQLTHFKNSNLTSHCRSIPRNLAETSHSPRSKKTLLKFSALHSVMRNQEAVQLNQYTRIDIQRLLNTSNAKERMKTSSRPFLSIYILPLTEAKGLRNLLFFELQYTLQPPFSNPDKRESHFFLQSWL